MRHPREFYISFVCASVICSLMFFMASTLVIIDIDDFRRQVEQLLRVDFSQVSAATGGFKQRRGEELAQLQAIGSSDSLFLREPDSPQVPEVEVEFFGASASPSEFPVQPPLGLASHSGDFSSIASSALGSGVGQDSASLRRGIKTNDAVAEHNQKNLARVVSRVKFKDPLVIEIDTASLSTPGNLTQLPVNPPEASGMTLPVDSSYTVQKILKRPPGGFPSLDDDIVARYFRQEHGGRNYFSVGFSLREGSELPVLPKDVLILIDVSQSMGRGSLSRIRNAVTGYLGSLSAADRWNVCIFSENTYSMKNDYSFFSASDFSAPEVSRFIRRPVNESMTDIFSASELILRRLPRSERPCNIFLISDGKANYSEVDVRRIVEGFSRQRRDNFSIFTFRAGAAGGDDLMRLLAYRSRGFFASHPGGEGLSAALLDFMRRYDKPVLCSCVASYTNLEKDQVYPGVLPNLYRGVPIIFNGYASSGEDFVLRVTGMGQNLRMHEFYFRPKGQVASVDAGIYLKWAQGRAYDMVQQIIDAESKQQLYRRLVVFRNFISGYGLSGFENMARLLEKSARR